MPLSLLDAMKAGCVCLSTAIGEIPQLFSENRGVLLQSVSPIFIAKEIEYLINSPNKMKTITDSAINYVETNFSISSFSLNISNLINNYEG